MRKMMRSILVLWLLVALLLPFQPHASTPPPANFHNLITDTCNTCAQHDPNLSYNFCVSSLEASPDSHCADDLHQLGKISLRLTKHNVSDTKHFVKGLFKNNNKEELDPFLRSCLNDCLELYSDAIPTLKEAIKDYNSKRYVEANFKVSSVMDASTTCEDGFKDKEAAAVSPLTQRNDDVFQLSALGLSIMNMLSS